MEDLLPRQEGPDEQHIYGVVIGIITSNQDEEELGRVKVKFPWRGEDEDDEGKSESYWARISSLMAGGDRGMVFYPEVDDEVLVAFEHGEINHPYVIGALWNGTDKPPETNSDGKNNIRKIKSRSGHEIIFNDEESGENIEIHSKSGHTVLLDDSAEKIEITDKNGSNFIIINSGENSITIESTGKLSIKSAEVSIESSGMMNIKSGGNLTIEGTLVKIN
jgi:uncharacterized protein involved in type VI secretion and phage assembly